VQHDEHDALETGRERADEVAERLDPSCGRADDDRTDPAGLDFCGQEASCL